jgi:hypothetical protein
MIISFYKEKFITLTILFHFIVFVNSQFTVQNIGGIVGGSASPQNNGKTVQIVSNQLSLCGLLGCSSSFGSDTTDVITFYTKVFILF